MKKFAIFLLIIIFSATGLAAFPSCKKITESDQYDPMHGVDTEGEDFEVISDGVSDYSIIVSDGAVACEKFAAQELSSFLKQSLNAELPVLSESQYSGGKYFSLGKTKKFENSFPDYNADSLGLDGFCIKTNGNNVFICGYRDRGTLYGVYDFLEKFVGVRFLTDKVTHVPQLSELSLYQMDIIEKPAFEIRSFWSETTQSDSLYAARLRTGAVWNVSEDIYGYGLYRDFYFNGHNVLTLTEADKNFEKHPECFSEIMGNRVKRDICWSNGINEDGTADTESSVTTVKLLTEGLKKIIIENPDVKYYFVGQEDSVSDVCSCAECSKIKNKYGTVSAGIVRMLNAVVRELQKWADADPVLQGKTIRLAAYAYTYSETPPVTGSSDGGFKKVDEQIVPNENVYLLLAPASHGNHAYSYIDESQDEWNKFMFDGWSYLTDNIMVYDYVTNFENYLWYLPNLSVLKENLLYFQKLNVPAVIFQAESDSGFQADLKAYICSRLMWHPQRNVNEIIEEFCTLYFGESAQTVMDFMADMEAHYAYLKSEYKEEFYMHMSTDANIFSAEMYPVRLLSEKEDMLAGAIGAVRKNTDISEEERAETIRRLSSVLLIPQRMILANYTSYFGQVGMKEYAQKFFDTCGVAGAELYAEGRSLEELKTSYGL